MAVLEYRTHEDKIRQELGSLINEEGKIIREITDWEASYWGLYPELRDFLNALARPYLNENQER